MSKFVAIVPAAGSSQRFSQSLGGLGSGGVKEGGKLLAELSPGLTVFAASLRALSSLDGLGAIVVPCREVDEPVFSSQLSKDLFEGRGNLEVFFVRGGKTRAESVFAGLSHESVKQADYVLVHDAARPCLRPDDIAKVVQAANESGAAILCAPVNSTLKRGKLGGVIEETLDRENVFAAQTPQVFRKEILLEAYEKSQTSLGASSSIPLATDEAMLVEQLGYPVTLVEGSSNNIKITRAVDLTLARAQISLAAE